MSMPFVKEAFTFRNPDGSSVDVLGWGDQDYAVFESLDGFTVIEDPNTGYYHYARLSDDRSELLPTGMRAGAGDPRSLGLEQHLRAHPQAIREKVRRARTAMGQRRWEVRRERRRTALQRSLEAGGPQPAPPSQTRTGTYVGLCVLIQFPDVTGTITKEEVSDFCNQQGYNGYGNNGSVYDYYFDNSGGRLKYTIVVTSYYTAKQKRSYYTDPSVAYTTRARELIKEALDDLKSQHFDFSQLSSDSDGYVYALNVFYAGDVVNNWSEGLWPHSSALAHTYDVGNGKRFRDYQITNMGSHLILATFCHENGHMLCDFPDLYDYGHESYGDGNYCLMGYHGSNTNPVEICAYLKDQAGWALQVTSLTSNYLVASVPASRNVFFKHINPTNPTEYFIIQNRQQQGRDASLPAAGLAIWHADELGSNNDEQMSPSQHYECALEQADGHFDLEKGINEGDNADLFASPQATRFADGTSPNANWWDGSPSGLDLSQISPSTETMTFQFSLQHYLSITLTPSSVIGGDTCIGTATLLAPAPVGGAAVHLTASGGARILGSNLEPVDSVVIPAGATSTTFTVSTERNIGSSVFTTITATYLGFTASAILIIRSTVPSLLSFVLSPNTITSGDTARGTLTLAKATPVGFLGLVSSSDKSVATVPFLVSIPSGRTSAFFTVSSRLFYSPRTRKIATIAVGAGDGHLHAILTVIGKKNTP